MNVMSPLEASCTCGRRYRVPPRAAGQLCRCSSCGETFRLPELPEPQEDDCVIIRTTGRGQGPGRRRPTRRSPGRRRRSPGRRPKRIGSGGGVGRSTARRRTGGPMKVSQAARVAVLVLGILGGVASGFLGIAWLGQYEDHRPMIEMGREIQAYGAQVGRSSAVLDNELQEIENLRIAAFFLLAGLIGGIGGGVAGFMGRTKLAGPVLIACALAPAVLAPKSLLFTFLLLIGGGIALAARARPQTLAAH